MLHLEPIRCFCTVVDTAHFHKAADLLHRTQPAVSQQIKRLEKELGHQLLDRKDNTPTPAGRLVYQKGRELLQAAESLEQEILDFDEAADQTLRFGTSDTNALYFIPPYVRALQKTLPNTRLEIFSRSSDQVADAVQQGDIDLGIITLPMDRPGLEVRKLYDQRLVLLVPHSHPMAHQHKTTLKWLRDESFVLLEPETRTGTLINRYFKENDFTPQVAMHTGSFEVIKRYVTEGMGISIVPNDVITEQEEELLIPVEIPGLPSVTIGATWRTGRYQTRAAREFIRILTADKISPD